MNYIYSLIGTLLFIILFQRPLKKYPIVFYILAVVIGILIPCTVQFGWEEVWAKEWPKFLYTTYKLFRKGAIGFGLFTWVMWAGCLKESWSFTKMLRRLRAEISIVAGLLVLTHNITYGFIGKKSYFVKLVVNAGSIDKPERVYAAIVSIIMLLIMIPLLITSFKCIRSKMDPTKWKKLHKLAYVFYFLVVVHICILWLPYWPKHHDGVLMYGIVFIVWAILRILKAKRIIFKD